MAFPEQRLKEMYKECNGKFDKMAELCEKEFGWTRGQAYMATEFLFRPENYN